MAVFCSDRHRIEAVSKSSVVARMQSPSLFCQGCRDQSIRFLNQHCLRRRNHQIQGHLHLVRPIARHYAHHTGLDRDDLLQVGCLGLIQASNRYDAERGTPFSSFAKPHIRGAILHFVRDRGGLIRIPRGVQERAIQALRQTDGGMNAADALMVGHYRSKHHWVEFNDDLVDDKPEGIELVERTETWRQVRALFETIETQEQQALQLVVIEGMSLRSTAKHLGVSAMTVQRRVKRGLRSLSRGLNKRQLVV